MLNRPKPVVLLVLNGLGYTLDKENNTTGIINAAVLVVEAVEASLQRVVDALKSVGGQMQITAGRGNIEPMVDKATRRSHAAQTTNPAPLIHVGGGKPLDAGDSLPDPAPTMPSMLGVAQPVEMTGLSLIKSV